MDYKDLTQYGIPHEDLRRTERKPATASQRRSWREATKRWRRAHPGNVARWKRENRMRKRAWAAILATGLQRGDLQPIMDELGLEAMKGHHRYSEYDTFAAAFEELCKRQEDKCLGCATPYALDVAARCTDRSVWGMVCKACAAYVHVPPYDEIDAIGENVAQARRDPYAFIGEILGTGRAR